MAAYEVLLLNTAVPQIQAAQSGDTYVVPRDIAFSAALTLSAGTANGVPYLNASKVLTTGSALTFDGTSLATTGLVSAAGGAFNGNINPASGSSVEITYVSGVGYITSYNRTSSAWTDLYFRAGANTIWSASGSEQMRLTSTGLGIGTSSPYSNLTVSSGASNDTRLLLQSNASGGSVNAGMMLGLIGSNGYVYNYANGPIVFGTNAADRVILDSSGNLGLGVTPSAWFSNRKAIDLGGAVSAVTGANITAFGNNYYTDTSAVDRYVSTGSAAQIMLFPQAGGVQWFTAPSGTAGNAITFTQAMTLDANGNLGIGATSIAGNLTNRVVLAQGADSANFVVTKTGGVSGSFVAFANEVYIGSDTNDPLVLKTNGTERARITSGGDFQTASGNSVMVGGTAARATTAGTNRVDIFDGTAPVGTLANGVSFYSTAGEARVMDAAGNATLLSPHDTATNEWIFHSKHTPTGKVLRIDVERLLKFVNDHFGLDAVHEFIEE